MYVVFEVRDCAYMYIYTCDLDSLLGEGPLEGGLCMIEEYSCAQRCLCRRNAARLGCSNPYTEECRISKMKNNCTY
jgi:hypothetical protein